MQVRKQLFINRERKMEKESLVWGFKLFSASLVILLYAWEKIEDSCEQGKIITRAARILEVSENNKYFYWINVKCIRYIYFTDDYIQHKIWTDYWI